MTSGSTVSAGDTGGTGGAGATETTRWELYSMPSTLIIGWKHMACHWCTVCSHPSSHISEPYMLYIYGQYGCIRVHTGLSNIVLKLYFLNPFMNSVLTVWSKI